MKTMKKIFPHLNIIMVFVLVTLLIIDICNPFMEFINNNITKGFIYFFCELTLLEAVFLFLDKGVVKRVLAYITTVLDVFLLTRLIGDLIKPTKEIVNSNITKGALWILCGVALFEAVIMLVDTLFEENKE